MATDIIWHRLPRHAFQVCASGFRACHEGLGLGRLSLTVCAERCLMSPNETSDKTRVSSVRRSRTVFNLSIERVALD
jgi:hypothetical protein